MAHNVEHNSIKTIRFGNTECISLKDKLIISTEIEIFVGLNLNLYLSYADPDL
jgi:hypothetical protein